MLFALRVIFLCLLVISTAFIILCFFIRSSFSLFLTIQVYPEVFAYLLDILLTSTPFSTNLTLHLSIILSFTYPMISFLIRNFIEDIALTLSFILIIIRSILFPLSNFLYLNSTSPHYFLIRLFLISWNSLKLISDYVENPLNSIFSSLDFSNFAIIKLTAYFISFHQFDASISVSAHEKLFLTFSSMIKYSFSISTLPFLISDFIFSTVITMHLISSINPPTLQPFNSIFYSKSFLFSLSLFSSLQFESILAIFMQDFML